MALAHRGDLELSLAQPVVVEEGHQRLEHHQRRARVGGRLLGTANDVVWGDGGHGRIARERYAIVAGPGATLRIAA